MILPSDVTRIQEETDADQKNSRQMYDTDTYLFWILQQIEKMRRIETMSEMINFTPKDIPCF